MTMKVTPKANRVSCQERSDEAIQVTLCAHNYTKIASSFLSRNDHLLRRGIR